MININNSLYIRSEKNGITVYEKNSNLYKFYEGINIEQINKFSEDYEKIINFLNINSFRINRNLKYRFPLRVNWLIEERCNLDCIYCFANDKMHDKSTKQNLIETANHILNLNIMNVGISGGEPFLNNYIEDVINVLKGKCSINIDTNGTICITDSMIKVLKEADVLVRITIDSIKWDTLNKLRPSKNNKDYLNVIYQNIKKLKQASINLMVHTVVTKYNINCLDDVAEKLIDLGVARWHLYGVNYAEKCKNIYEKIKISKKNLLNLKERLIEKYGRNIFITFYFNDKSYSANSVVLIDSEGRFYLDSIFNNTEYIGKDSKKPTAMEIADNLDIASHLLGYLWTGDDND